MPRLDALRPSQLAALFAATLPSLLAFNVAPSPTFLNQALALAGWGLFAAAIATDRGLPPWGWRDMRPAAPVATALAIVAGCAAASGLFGALPSSLAWSAIGLLLASAILLVAGVTAARGPSATTVWAAFCAAWAAAGMLNAAIAAIQVFSPGWADGSWIANSSIPGRAVGNLRQPNHLSSLLMWAAIGGIGLVEMRRLTVRAGAVFLSVTVFAIVLTASRTGLVGVLLLAVWALVDRRLTVATRRMLFASPLIYASGWASMAAWSRVAHATFGGEQRLAEADLSASRFAIWSDTLSLIREQPWTGVGFGEFNFAWTLSVMPRRPTAFFDHTHNLPLQLAVELGIPVALLVLGLLIAGLWRGIVRARSDNADASLAARCGLAMLVLIGVHSLLEYPLWYSYFLLPTAFVFGLVAGTPERPVDRPSPAGRRALALGSAALVLGTAAAVADFWRVVAIFSVSAGGPPLQERIERGRASVLFAHHAAYAQATVANDPGSELPAFGVAAHYLIDTRLLMGWAEGFAAAGDSVRASYLAQRLREFRNPLSADFLGVCDRENGTRSELPFQCRMPDAALHWRDFVAR